jgi:hypothetical protein
MLGMLKLLEELRLRTREVGEQQARQREYS